VDKVGLLVVVGRENNKVDDALEDLPCLSVEVKVSSRQTYSSELVGVLLDRLGIQDLPVVLADIEVLAVVLGQGDLLLVVPELEVRHVVLRLDGRVVNASGLLLLLALLLVLLKLLGGLLGPTLEVLCADLPAQNTRLCPVALFYA
jgi:hypothetical protein